MQPVPPVRRLVSSLLLAASTLAPTIARAHCDRLDGPVAGAARAALESGRFEAVQIWVAEPQEAALREAWEMARQARDEGPAAARLAERYLIETAVRLHRQAEGMSYEGVAPAGLALPQDVAAGDRAIESGDVDPVLTLLSEEMRHKTRHLFEEARAALARRDESVEAGREWVDAYVRYIVFVHGLHESIQAGPAHGVGHAD
ncbi:MAG TPA: DUF6448 family protein [Thermoanaerobaculia bacterium]|nr:DUF6448 family protein [Thermoanaerobaculia bacterium]